jgi:hypothetical protein
MSSKASVFNDPSYAKLLQIFTECEVPEFVKEASAESDQSFSDVTMDWYADPVNKKYPMNNKSNTWLSREYFRKDRGSFSKQAAESIGKRLDKAAVFWGLEKVAYKNIEAPKGPVHFVEVKHEGHTRMSFPLKSAFQTKEACEYLKKNASKLTYEMRRTMAKGLYSSPSDFKTELTPADEMFIEKTAGYGVSIPSRVNHAIGSRVTALRTSHPEYADRLVKLAHELKGTDLTPVMLDKAASMLDLIDRATDLHKAYNNGLSTPEEDLFCMTQKAAESIGHELVELTNGSRVMYSDLIEKKAQVDEFFRNVVGEIPYSNSKDMVDIIRSLPRDDADGLEKALEE